MLTTPSIEANDMVNYRQLAIDNRQSQIDNFPFDFAPLESLGIYRQGRQSFYLFIEPRMSVGLNGYT